MSASSAIASIVYNLLQKPHLNACLGNELTCSFMLLFHRLFSFFVSFQSFGTVKYGFRSSSFIEQKDVDISVGFVAAAVSMPMGGCRGRRPVDDVSLVSAETVDVIVAAELAVL